MRFYLRCLKCSKETSNVIVCNFFVIFEFKLRDGVAICVFCLLHMLQTFLHMFFRLFHHYRTNSSSTAAVTQSWTMKLVSKEKLNAIIPRNRLNIF